MAVIASIVSAMSASSKGQLVDMVKARRKLVEPSGDSVTERPAAFNEQQKSWIVSFCERPDISYTSPGRKDQVCIGKGDDGSKVYHCKHDLLWKLKEVIPLMNKAIKSDHEKREVSEFTVTYRSLWRFLKNIYKTHKVPKRNS